MLFLLKSVAGYLKFKNALSIIIGEGEKQLRGTESYQTSRGLEFRASNLQRGDQGSEVEEKLSRAE